VTARINRKELILESVPMKELFLRIVKRAKAKFNFRIENFCIMGNHFHFIIRPESGESLSSIMQWILSVFAMAYNRLYHLTGHVWGCRFFSRILSTRGMFIETFRYINENPVRAGQVTDPRYWRYGGLWHNREGCQEILDELPEWIASIFAQHLAV
jgi:putative transposase